MTIPSITPLPAYPDPDTVEFSDNIGPWAAALGTMTDEFNARIAQLNEFSTGAGGVSDWTFRVSDASGNNSATSVTGRAFVLGNLVMVGAAGLNDISTAGLVSGDAVRIILPFTVRAALPGFGAINIQTMGSVNGTGVSFAPFCVQGSNFCTFRNVGRTGTSVNMLVSNLTSGSTDIADFAAIYVRS